ncbi:dihydrolipoamide acetyltransferase family protein [Agromyces sp. NPDC058110]|uniref:dihydrolipoamide acetyltransferase family protein n=1 Tax=Agromyces sp. NPDC058110 TaxID=3346345 RepID=UPI0036DCDB96
MTMIRDFPLPDLGEGLTESEIVAWRVAVGDRVELNQIIADVETAKAVVELPSPFAGVVTALHAGEGETVNVGEPLFSCDTGEGDSAAPATAPTDAAAAPVAAAPVVEASTDAASGPNLVGYGARAESGPKRRARRAALAADLVPTLPEAAAGAGVAAESAVAPSSTNHAPAMPSERPRSTPPVRKLAHDLGIDLALVRGTGERGLVTRADVEAAASGVGAPVDADTPAVSGSAARERLDMPAAADVRIPIKGVRKHTAAAMVASAFTAPHVTEFLTVDVTSTMDLVRSLREDPAFAGHRVTPLAVVAKAVCLAARRTPDVNAKWDEDAQEIVQFGSVNLGIAAATERGLVVPNVKAAERLTLIELADAIGELAVTAREGRTRPADLTGGTLSITNVGVFGVDAGTPILNPGEAVILATGAARRQPWEFRGEIALREVMTLSLSFDHRLVDGQQAAAFLTDVGAILRDPARALTMI